MESVRILQDTYEKLYVLTRYLAKLMDEEIQKIDGWKAHCDSILAKSESWKHREKTSWDNFYELDLYYLLFILKKSWRDFARVTGHPFFTDENRKLFVGAKSAESDDYSVKAYSIWDIRNTVAHPENMGFLEGYFADSHDEKYNRYKNWDETIDRAAEQLGFSMGKMLCENHEKEKEELAQFIFENSTYITMNSDQWKNGVLSQKVREAIERTKMRIETQSTAAGIMAFFRDSQFLDKGNFVKEELQKYNLPTFESVLDKIWYRYYGFSG